MKRTLRWMLILSTVLTAVVIGLLLLAQTNAAKGFLARQLTSSLSQAPDRRLVIEGIQGWIPTDLRIARLELGDRQGTWLTLTNARLAWSFWDLFQKTVRIDLLSAERIHIERTPLPTAATEKKTRSAESSGIPGYLPALELHRLDIKELALGQGLIGPKAVLSVTGRVRSETGADRIEAALDMVRTDPGPATKLTTRGEWLRSSRTFSLRTELKEDPDGLIAALTKLDHAGAIRLRLEGKGPLTQWQGRLDAAVDRIGEIRCGLELGIEPEWSFLADGSIQVRRGFLPETWREIPADRELFHLQASSKNFHRLSLTRFRLSGADHRIALNGTIDLGTLQFQAELSAQADDLSRLEPVLQNHVRGGAELTGSFSGTLQNPSGSLQFKLHPFGWNQIELASAELGAKADASPESTWANPLYRIQSRGKVEIVRIPGIEPLPERAIDWDLDASLEGDHRLRLKHLSLVGTQHGLEAEGELGLDDRSGKLNARLRADTIRLLGALAGVQADGSAALQVSAERRPGEENAVADVSLQLRNLTEVKPVPPELLGNQLDLTGHLRFQPGHELQVKNLRLANPFLQAEAEAAIDLETQRAEATAKVTIPDLKPLSAVAQQPVAGKAELTASIAGPWTGFGAELKVDGENITVGETTYNRVLSSVKMENLPTEPKGTAAVSVRQAQDELKASTGFRYFENQLDLTQLDLAAPNCEIHGNLRLDLNSKRLEGLISGRIPDLRDLGRILGRPLQGNVAFDAQLSRASGRQDIVLAGHGKGIRNPSMSLGEFTLNANFKDLYRHPQGRAELKVKTLRAASASLDQVAIQLEGNRQAIAFQGTLDGRYRSKLSLKTGGSLSFLKAGKRLQLNLLQGRYGPVPFDLRAPLQALMSSEGLSLERLDLGIATGRLQGSAKLTRQSVAADLAVADFPLAVLQPLGAPAVKGTLNLSATMSGPPSSPSVSARARLMRVQGTDSDLEPLPPADLDLSAKLADGRLQAKLQVSGLSQQPLQAEGFLPVKLSVRPGHFEIPQKSEWKAHLAGDLQLQPLALLFLPEEQRVAGNLAAALSGSGTLDSIRLSGNLKLREGRYENLDLGLLLTNIDGIVAVTGDRLSVEDLNANAGTKGKVSVTGDLRLLPGKHFPLQLKATLIQAPLLQSDQVHATADGTVELQGDVRSMGVSGNLELVPVEIRVPDQLGPNLPELQVIEINRPGDEQPSRDAAPKGPPINIGLHVDVNLPQRLFVRGRGLESEWQGRLKVRGTTAQPIVAGNLELVRGYLDFLSKRLDLADSTIQFTGAAPPDPVLDIKAEDQADDVTARILVTGTASDPDIHLESDPTLPEDEVMSRLLFGKSIEKISATQALQIALALRTLAGSGGSMNLMGRTRSLLGVDQLDLRQGESAESSKIGVGKYLTDDIYVDVEQGMGGEGGRVRVEMEVLPNVTVDSEINSKSETGIGLNWKYDY